MDKVTLLIALAVIVYFLLQFYEEYAKNKAVRDSNQLSYDEYANAQFVNQTKRKEYKTWERAANAILDPANLLGMR